MTSIRPALVHALIAAVTASAAGPARVPVLGQIALPHNYYYRELYLPQLTSGPSSVAWSPDGASLIYSMQGTLWRQGIDSSVAEQLTDDRGTDYQPDWSPDGRRVAFVRYDGRSMELMRLDLATRSAFALTTNGAVNVEPRWSPTGDRLAFVSTATTGHFLLHVAQIRDGRIATTRVLTPDRRSAVPRYYYSPFDHAINPAWTRDGREIIFVSNREIAHGTGDIVRVPIASGTPRVIRHEETAWHARPDVSPDGTRIVYSSYLGRQWQQLWLLPAEGGYPFPLTYGDYDDTNPRWSPDGRTIAFISNRSGNTALWLIDVTSGAQRQLQIAERRCLQPRRELDLRVVDEEGRALAARISVSDSRQRSYAPDDAWVHADDMLAPERQAIETRYFHSAGRSRISVPVDRLTIVVSHGPAYEVAHLEEDARVDGWSGSRTVTLHQLAAPPGLPELWSGDLHVHMNYGGLYRNTPAHLAEQGRAEDLNLIYNLVVNKEQRIPDIASFNPDPDPASTENLLIMHGQEFHTSYWGHLTLLHLAEHLLLPAYAAYPLTAAASPYPHNAAVADLAHRQHALVGYAHPFDVDVDPVKDASLTNELPVDAALGKVDYYEAVGFSDHKATNAVWYRLLDCGLQIPAGAGTDAMANYASLRGPVGMNRVYVPSNGRLTGDAFLAALTAGQGVATNGALLYLQAGEARLGDTARLSEAGTLDYRATLRANFPVDHLELVWNGSVVSNVPLGSNRQSADVRGSIPVQSSGWLLLRAWNDDPDPDLMDIYRYATTSPIYVWVRDQPRRSRQAGTYFLAWLDRLRSATEHNAGYRTSAERNAVLQDISRARVFYEQCRSEGH
ncbi:MAG TPA: CehA/McbA family metallohydrolase [Vicinamibacterales bacterium]